MQNSPQFISWAYDPTINQERSDILLHVVNFIRDGVCDPYSHSPTLPSFFQQLDNSVKAAIFELTQTPFAKPLPKRSYAPAGSTIDLFVAAFERSSSFVVNGAPVGAFHLNTDALTDEIARRIGAIWHPEINEDGGLPAAFEATYSNLARANSRLALLYSLPRLLGARFNLEGFDAAREVLLYRQITMQRNLLLFGSLLGDEARRRALQAVAPSTCYTAANAEIKFAVMHHLQRDGVSSGSFRTADEALLQADIKRAYEAL